MIGMVSVIDGFEVHNIQKSNHSLGVFGKTLTQYAMQTTWPPNLWQCTMGRAGWLLTLPRWPIPDYVTFSNLDRGVMDLFIAHEGQRAFTH